MMPASNGIGGEEGVPTIPRLLQLPDQVRFRIWDNLSRTDHKALRSTSRAFRDELDNKYGVHAIVQEPIITTPDVSQHGCVKKVYAGTDSNEKAEKIHANMEWIKSVAVRSLKMKDLKEIPFVPDTLLADPLGLERFVCVVDVEPAPKVNQFLRLCKNLKTVRISFTAPISVDLLRSLTPDYYPLQFFQNVLQGLDGSKPDLRELSVRLARNLDHEHGFYRLLGMPKKPQVPLAHNYPKRLRILKLEMPFIWRSMIEDWLPLIEAQEKLVHLQLRLGLVYWDAWSKVIEKNSQTLQHVDLLMVNIIQADDSRTRYTWPDPQSYDIDQDCWFDWLSSGLANVETLKSIKISMFELFTRHTCKAYMSRNFQYMNLDHVKRLEFLFVALGSSEVEALFLETPSLQYLKLKAWTRALNEEALKLRAVEVCELVARVMPWNKYRAITLADVCLAFWNCPYSTRDMVPKRSPNYYVLWSPKNGYGTGFLNHFLRLQMIL